MSSSRSASSRTSTVLQNTATVPHLLGWDKARAPGPRRRAAGAGRPRPGRLRRPLPGPALRRPAAAGRRGPGAGGGPAGAADGRAVRRRGPGGPRAAAERVPAAAGRGAQDGAVRHPRHRGGGPARRPDRGVRRGAGSSSSTRPPPCSARPPATYVAEFVGADRGPEAAVGHPDRARATWSSRRSCSWTTRWTGPRADAARRRPLGRRPRRRRHLHGWVPATGAARGGGTVADHARRMEAWLPLGAPLKQAFSTMLQHDAGWIAVLDGRTGSWACSRPATPARGAAPLHRRRPARRGARGGGAGDRQRSPGVLRRGTRPGRRRRSRRRRAAGTPAPGTAPRSPPRCPPPPRSRRRPPGRARVGTSSRSSSSHSPNPPYIPADQRRHQRAGLPEDHGAGRHHRVHRPGVGPPLALRLQPGAQREGGRRAAPPRSAPARSAPAAARWAGVPSGSHSRRPPTTARPPPRRGPRACRYAVGSPPRNPHRSWSDMIGRVRDRTRAAARATRAGRVPGHPGARPLPGQRGQQVGHRAAAGHLGARVDVVPRREDEGPLVRPRVRERRARGSSETTPW